MKFLQISLLIILPIQLLSQKPNKFEITDSVINVKEILRTEFGQEMMKRIEQLESMNSPYSFGILKLNNVFQEDKDKEMEKIPGGCQCHMVMGKLEIANAIGFMGGIASVTEVNLADSTYRSKLFYHTDGMKTHKFKPDDEFIEDIDVILEESRLEISPDSKFENNGVVKGKLIGTSVKYYEKDYSDKGYKEVQTKVLSIFKCKLQDYGQMMIKMKQLEEKKKKEKERKN